MSSLARATSPYSFDFNLVGMSTRAFAANMLPRRKLISSSDMLGFSAMAIAAETISSSMTFRKTAQPLDFSKASIAASWDFGVTFCGCPF